MNNLLLELMKNNFTKSSINKGVNLLSKLDIYDQ